MTFTRRNFLELGAASALAGMALPSWGQGTWPTRPVKLISPYGAGGSNDISARLLAQEFGHAFGQSFVVENKPGAGTRVALDYVAHAPADGYTLIYAAAPLSTVEALYGKMSFDPVKDLQPIAFCMLAPIFLIVNAQAPYKTLQEFIAYGKSKAGGVNFGSPGAGSVPHLTAELFMRETGMKGVNVHFRGDAQAYTELLAGRVDATLTAIVTALPHIKSGKLRVLGVASEKRSITYPDAPTLREQGLNVVGYGWYGLMAPAATPRAITERVETETGRILAEPAVKQQLLALGLEPRPSTASEFAAFIQSESHKWSDVIRKAGIKGE